MVSERPHQLEITAEPQNAAQAREHVREAAARHDFSPTALADIEVAVGEAVTNAILYGSPSATSRIVITHQFDHAEQSFHVEIRDQGSGFDPDHVRVEDSADALGGRGLRLMRALLDAVTLYYDGSGMVVRLCKKRR